MRFNSIVEDQRSSQCVLFEKWTSNFVVSGNNIDWLIFWIEKISELCLHFGTFKNDFFCINYFIIWLIISSPFDWFFSSWALSYDKCNPGGVLSINGWYQCSLFCKYVNIVCFLEIQVLRWWYWLYLELLSLFFIVQLLYLEL